MSRRGRTDWRTIYTIGARSIIRTREVRIECSTCVWYFDQARWLDNLRSVGFAL